MWGQVQNVFRRAVGEKLTLMMCNSYCLAIIRKLVALDFSFLVKILGGFTGATGILIFSASATGGLHPDFSLPEPETGVMGGVPGVSLSKTSSGDCSSRPDTRPIG